MEPRDQGYSELAQSLYHYHHLMMWRELRLVQDRLQVLHQQAVRELGQVPDYLLRFAQALELVLEEVPQMVLAQQQDQE
jgi:hypothetical protein